ncbi:Calx-beta domain-containing protein [Ketobacter sp.]|nr:MAG: hypothetical protein D6160_15870 [Ketobacter sp.]
MKVQTYFYRVDTLSGWNVAKKLTSDGELSMPRIFSVVACVALIFSWTTAVRAVEFTEISPSVSGLNYVGESWGASWGDFNGDGYPDIYSSNHRARPSIWRNNGDGTFTDIVIQFDKSRTWLDFPFTDTHGGAWGDFDNNGTQDLLVLTGVNFPAALFVNDGAGVTTDETAARSFPDDKEGRTATWFDYDNDGLLDVVINNRAPNLFLRQSAGSFSDITPTVGLQSFRTNYGILSDLDQDDSMELFAIGDGDFPEKVYKTDTVPFFDITESLPFSGLVVDAAIADFNNDLMPDILLVRGNLRPNQTLKVVDGDVGEPDIIEAWLAGGEISGERGLEFQASGPITVTVDTQLGLPKFFIGSGGYRPTAKTFTLDPAVAADQGISFHDENLDQGFYMGYDTASGSWKLWLSPASSSTRAYIIIEGVDMTDPVAMNLTTGDYDIAPKLFLNVGGGGFTDTSGIGLSTPVSCVATTVGDFDNDMDLDIYMVCRNGIENISNKFYMNLGDGSFVDVSGYGAEGAIGAGLPSGAGVGENVIAADYDVDGWLDLYVLNGLLMNPIRVGGPDQLFRNTSFNTSTNRWIELDLQGTISNRDAIGSKVIVTAGGVSQLREQGGHFHRWSQNHSRLHIGLGQNDLANIEVRWPNGEIDVFTDVSANNLYKITQGVMGNQTGTISDVTVTDGATDFPAPEAGDECGVPPDEQPENFPFAFDSAQDRGLFIWKDCSGTGEWYVRATGGGGNGMEYLGQVITNSDFTNVVGYGLEGNDTLNHTAAGTIDFFMKMSNSGIDGFDFTLTGSAGACLDMFTLPEGAQVFLGGGHIPVSTPFNLNTFESCANITAEDTTVNEDDGTVSLTVGLSRAAASTITVDYAFVDDTAFLGSDYTAEVSAGSLTFNPGELSKTLTFTLVQDAEFEQTEHFLLTLSNASGGFILDDQAQITIEDDDSCIECGAPTYDKTTEKAILLWKDFDTGSWHIKATAGGDPAGVIYGGSVGSTRPFVQVLEDGIEPSDTLDYTTSPDNIDYVLKIYNNGEDGFVFTPDETAITCFSPTQPAGIPVLVGQSKTAKFGAFNLNTFGSCLELSVTNVTVSEAAGVATFTVELSEASTDVVTVDVSTQAGTATAGVDYEEISVAQTLTFNPGEISKTVDVVITQDSLGEGDESFTFNLNNPVNATLATLSATATIIDDELNACGAPVYDPSVEKALFVWRDCDTGEWYVRASAGGDPAGVFYEGQFTSDDGFTGLSGYSLEPSDTLDNTTDPTVIEYVLKIWNNGDDGFQFKPVTEAGSCMNLESPSGIPILAGSEKEPISSPFDLGSLATCTNIAVDVSINDIEVNEADASAEFTVSLSAASGAVVTVDYVTQSGSATADEDFTAVTTPTTITFNPGVTSQQISIPILEDNLSESEETFDVVLSNANNATLDKPSGRATILDNEISPCGMPSFDSANDQNIYLWKDCGTDNWHLSATAGGSASQLIYFGEFMSSAAITGVVENSIEVNDTVDGDADPAILNFLLKMKTTGYDGFDFTTAPGSTTCLTVDPSSPGAGSVVVGAAQTLLTTPIDLATLAACQ